MGQRKKAVFIYARGVGFVGQSQASALLVDGLRRRGWQIRVINPLILNRVTAKNRGQALLAKAQVLWRLLIAWAQGLWPALSSDPLYVNLGQTRYALIRDGFPLLVRWLLARHGRAAIALHGSLFMQWQPQSFEAEMLRRMVQPARTIAILGPTQRQKMIELGIPVAKVVQVDNTCLLPPISEQECRAKHKLTPQQPLNVLYLSNLIESKGYPEFVEAIGQLSAQADGPVAATLCGQIVAMDADSRFASHDAARNWLETQLAGINQSASVRLRWINGAAGEAKQNLFRAAHIFVLPSRYKVEAQPAVVIEALASGCAVIASKAGEIPTMVSHETAVLLDDVTPAAIANAIVDLHRHPAKRRQLAETGLALFQARYAYDKHINRWEELLGELDA